MNRPVYPATPQPCIRAVVTAVDYDAMAQLIREYVAWLRTRYRHDEWFVTEVLDKQSLTSELAALSEMYGAPKGKAFIAVAGSAVLGCGAYRALGGGACEMKRFFVPDRHRGRGIGRQLCRALLAAARDDGFQEMKLDTGRLLSEAIGLYRSLGFQECEPYYDYPDRLLPYLMFMSRPLADLPGRESART